jgi:uncharacterized protein with von Willebrand factor type A (vWA) domain
MESDVQWERADLVIMSDGYFQVGDEARRRIDKVRKEKGLRVTGILTGDKRDEFDKLCGPGKVHPLGKWELY